MAALARRQERELRDWLLRGETPTSASGSLDTALRDAVAEIEELHEVTIEAVIVGDAALTPTLEALVGATREALLNAAVHGGGGDRALREGPRRDRDGVRPRPRPRLRRRGLDPARRGVRDSIVGRLDARGRAGRDRHRARRRLRSDPQGAAVKLANRDRRRPRAVPRRRPCGARPSAWRSRPRRATSRRGRRRSSARRRTSCCSTSTSRAAAAPRSSRAHPARATSPCRSPTPPRT